MCIRDSCVTFGRGEHLDRWVALTGCAFTGCAFAGGPFADGRAVGPAVARALASRLRASASALGGRRGRREWPPVRPGAGRHDPGDPGWAAGEPALPGHPRPGPVSYTHLRAHETVLDIV